MQQPQIFSKDLSSGGYHCASGRQANSKGVVFGTCSDRRAKENLVKDHITLLNSSLLPLQPDCPYGTYVAVDGFPGAGGGTNTRPTGYLYRCFYSTLLADMTADFALADRAHLTSKECPLNFDLVKKRSTFTDAGSGSTFEFEVVPRPTFKSRKGY